MSQFINSIREVKRNYNKYDNWEQTQADEKAKKQYLAENLDIPKDKIELTTAKAKAVIRASELLDTRSENNCENMEQFTSTLSMFALLPMAFAPLLFTKSSLKKQQIANIVSIFATLGLGAGLVLWSNSKQKEASRIGRFQAKQNELKDIKNFVIYTPEQIAEASKLAGDKPDKKEHKSFLKIYSELKDVFKNKDAYKKWVSEKDPEFIDKLKQKDYSPQQIRQGEEDKELIVDTVKDINIKAEEYSENVENAFDTMSTVSFLAAVPLAFGINKVLKAATKMNSGPRTAISTMSSLLVGLVILVTGTAEQKTGAKIGRYKAKQDLLKNPASLMYFTEQEKEKAKDIKADKQKLGFFEKLGGSFKFLNTYFKEKKEYENYKKKELNINEKIIDELKKMEVSDKQLKDAKHLQEKVFTAFDEIDEMSQRYSEDTEAGTEIVKQTMGTLWSLLSLGVMALGAVMIAKGNFPFDKIIKKLSSLGLDKNSSIRQLIDQAHEILKNDKSLRKDFNLFRFDKLLTNEKLAPIGNGIRLEFMKLASLGTDTKAIKDSLQAHCKKGPVAKWVRNLTFEGIKLKVRQTALKLSRETKIPLPKIAKDNLTGAKNYKTMIGTGTALAVPALGIIIGVPYAFNAWLTNIQKKAGKIGIMKAMDKIDDPKIFVNETASIEQPQQKTNTTPATTPQTSN